MDAWLERDSLNINTKQIGLFYTFTDKNDTIELEVESVINKNQFQTNVAIPMQKHTDNVMYVESSGRYSCCDGLVSNLKFSLILSLSVADCVPICMHDPITGNYGLIHSGWRGTNKKISNQAIKIMIDRGSEAKDIKVYLGPSISKDKYEVDGDVALLFSKQNYTCSGKKFLLDIKSQIKDDLLDVGVENENISSSSICTYSNLDFPSYRRDSVKAGRIIFLMGKLNG